MATSKTFETRAALYHLPASLAAYGDVTRYDLGSAVGLLEYVIDFVNRPHKVTPEQMRSGVVLPRGRENLRRLLVAAVHEDSDLANPSEDFIRQGAAGIRWEHRLELAPNGAQWRHHAHILGAEGFYNLIASLLMREENRAKVKQCRYLGKAGKEPEPACDKFFIVQPRAKHDGPPNVLYCSHEHMRAANDAGAADRQRAKRARDAALKILGGASKVKAAADVKQAQLQHPDATPEQLVIHVKRARKHK